MSIEAVWVTYISSDNSNDKVFEIVCCYYASLVWFIVMWLASRGDIAINIDTPRRIIWVTLGSFSGLAGHPGWYLWSSFNSVDDCCYRIIYIHTYIYIYTLYSNCVHWLVLGSTLVLLLHYSVEFILVTLLRIVYRYFIKYTFLWLRGGHEVINRVVTTDVRAIYMK